MAFCSRLLYLVVGMNKILYIFDGNRIFGFFKTSENYNVSQTNFCEILSSFEENTSVFR